MFIQVRLLKGFPKPLLYSVPDNWPKADLVGRVVHVPIQKRTEHALILEQYKQKPAGNKFDIRPALALEPFPLDPHYQTFIKKLADHHQLDPLHFFKRMRKFIADEKKAIQNRSSLSKSTTSDREKCYEIILTNEQQQVVDFILPKIKKLQYTPTILHGVTGSGKTECYKAMIVETIKNNKSALLLLPEVTLALQFENIMRAQLPKNITIFGFHSVSTARDKKRLWKALLAKQPLLVIGVHLPILLPIPNLGLIVVDEEHEVGYQEKKHPHINSKEAAILRAHTAEIPIVLGSATPSISSLYNIKKHGWHFFQLKKRFAGAFPKIKTVFLTDKKFRRNFWISQKLENSIQDRLSKQEQVIIFLNRRGFSFFVQCKDCGFIFECPNCSVSLTLHNNDQLTCHYCKHSQTLPDKCSTCKTTKKTTFIKKGIGTQQVVSILEKLFPFARIGRADLDTTRKKKLWHETVAAFKEKKLDILVGTQTITKGYHFPGVTLVGILWADLNLHFPTYNATETTLQQLLQVAGRAGRQSEQSTVIVQAMDNHPVLKYLNEIDYLQFYASELKTRKQLGYPPYGRLAQLEIRHTNQEAAEAEANQLVEYLLSINQKMNLSVQIMGPSEPPVSKIKRTYIRKIYLKSNSPKAIKTLIRALGRLRGHIKTLFTPHQA